MIFIEMATGSRGGLTFTYKTRLMTNDTVLFQLNVIRGEISRPHYLIDVIICRLTHLPLYLLGSHCHVETWIVFSWRQGYDLHLTEYSAPVIVTMITLLVSDS